MLGFVVVELGLISPSVTTGFKYKIPANESQVQTQEELASKLNDYSTNMEFLEGELKKIGIGLNEFKNNVSMEVVISTNQNGFQGLIVEFQSSLPSEKLKPIYKYISNDIKTIKANKACHRTPNRCFAAVIVAGAFQR